MSAFIWSFYQQYILVLSILLLSIPLVYADPCDVETQFTLTTGPTTQNFCALAQSSGGGCIPVGSDNQDSAVWKASVEKGVRCALLKSENFDELVLSEREELALTPVSQPDQSSPSISPPQSNPSPLPQPPSLTHGTITATPVNPNCQSQCKYTLSAQPKTDYQFSHWTGDDPVCQGDQNTLTVTRAGVEHCQAVFHPTPPTLSGGEMIVKLVDENCVENCQYQVTTQPAAGYEWSRWDGSGACQGTEPELILTSEAVINCSANFIVQSTPAQSNPAPTPIAEVITVEFPDTLIEGESGSVVVTRPLGNLEALKLAYVTQAGTAEAGIDYQSLAGELWWQYGEATTKEITLHTFTDNIVEATEAFTLLFADTNVTSVTLKIVDNSHHVDGDKALEDAPTPTACATAPALYSSVPETVTLQMNESPLDIFFVNVQGQLTLTTPPDTTLINLPEVVLTAHPARLRLEARAIGNTQLTVQDACQRVTINIQVEQNEPAPCRAQPLAFTQAKQMYLAVGESKILQVTGDIDPRYTAITHQTLGQGPVAVISPPRHNAAATLGVYQLSFTGKTAGTLAWTLGNCHNTETLEIQVFNTQQSSGLLQYHCAHANQAHALCDSASDSEFTNSPFIDNFWLELGIANEDLILNPVVADQAELPVDLTIIAPLAQLGERVEILFAVFNRSDNQYFRLSGDRWVTWDAQDLSALRGTQHFMGYLTPYAQNLPTRGLTPGQYQLYVAYRSAQANIADTVAELSSFRISNSRSITTTNPPQNSASAAWFDIHQTAQQFSCGIEPALEHTGVDAILTVIGVEPPDITTSVAYEGGTDVKYFVYNSTTQTFISVDAYNTQSVKYPQGNWEAESAMLKQHTFSTAGQLVVDLPFALLSALGMPTPAAYYFFCGYFAKDQLIFNTQPGVLIK